MATILSRPQCVKMSGRLNRGGGGGVRERRIHVGYRHYDVGFITLAQLQTSNYVLRLGLM